MVMVAALVGFLTGGCGERTDGSAADGPTPALRAAGPPPRELLAFVDDSLTRSFERLARRFETLHPDCTIRIEGSPGLVAVRKVAELGRRADLVAVADYRVIQRQLMPNHAEWYVCFARNEMVVAYSHQSPHVDELKENNWYRVVNHDDVTYGYPDPATDPCGYRTKLVWQLAERYYRASVRGMAITSAFAAPLRRPVVRPSTSSLLPLLQTGAVDYVFTYRSVAEQQNLPYLRLKDMVNLGAPNLTRFYGQASVTVPGFPEPIVGEPIAYAFTIPTAAPNAGDVRLFADFILGSGGAELLAADHQDVIPGGRMGFTEQGKPLLRK